MILNKLKIKIFGGVYLCKMALIVTEYGKTAIVRSVTQDIPVNIKYIGIGAGNITLNSLTTDLVDVRYIGEISEYQISSVPDPDHPDETLSNIVLYMNVPSENGGYTIREIALYMYNSDTDERDENAFAIGTIYPVYKPTSAEAEGSSNLTIRCTLKISSNANITISTAYDNTIDPKIENAINKFFSNQNNYEDKIKGLIPQGGNFGDILFKNSNSSGDYIWLKQNMMVPNMIGTDENENKFIN